MQQVILEALASQRNIADGTDVLTEVELEQRLLAFQLLGEGLAIAILEDLPPAQQAELLQAMNPFELVEVLEALKLESRHALFANLSLEVVEPLIAQLNELSPLLIPALFGGWQLNWGSGIPSIAIDSIAPIQTIQRSITGKITQIEPRSIVKKSRAIVISCCLNTIIQTSKSLNAESCYH